MWSGAVDEKLVMGVVVVVGVVWWCISLSSVTSTSVRGEVER